MRRVQVIDSHTAGEPTRVVVSGGPDLGRGSLAERRQRFAHDFDGFRSAVVNEPRGSDVLVGALLCEPTDPTCCAGVIYFNNVGMLNMCGHGTIGVAVTLAHLGRITPGEHRLETPVGVVGFEYRGGSRVTIQNVPSYRYKKSVPVGLNDGRTVTGDIAWGGNWFFLCSDHGQELVLSEVERLTEVARRIRWALLRDNVIGAGHPDIDHIELLGPPASPQNHGRNFVLCPGSAYDRSPCGTGTSAKLACLHADGKLDEGQVWRQESILGTVFEGTIQVREDMVIPRITGEAYVTAEATLLLDPADPFEMGIRV
jgi:4-hydroxyproline epimerase